MAPTRASASRSVTPSRARGRRLDEGDEEAPPPPTTSSRSSTRDNTSHAAPSGQRRTPYYGKSNRVAPAGGGGDRAAPTVVQRAHAVAEEWFGDDEEDPGPKQELMTMSQRLPPLPLPPNAINAPPDYVLLDRTGRVPMRVRCHIMSLHDINTVNQTFTVKMWLQLAWFTKRRDISNVDYSTEWKPRLSFLDSFGSPEIFESQVPRELPCDSKDRMLISCRWVVDGTFGEKMELEDFPLDHQKLHIRAAVWDSQSYVVTNPDEMEAAVERRAVEKSIKFYRGQSFVYDEAFVQSDEWDLDPVLNIEQDFSRHERHDDHIQSPIINIFVVVSRKPLFFLYNIILPIMMLVVLSFISFFFPDSELEPKMTVTLTIVLTLVALKFVVAQYLPTTSYLTRLDQYVVVSFTFVFLVAIQNTLVYYIFDQHSESDARLVNVYTGWALAGAWGLINVAALFVFIWLLLDKSRYMDVYSYRDWEARPLPPIGAVISSSFPFPTIVDRSDIVMSRHVKVMKGRHLSKRRKAKTLWTEDPDA